MALMDLQTSRERLAIVDKVGNDLRHTAWVAANPQLAAEVELWAQEPRRASRLNGDTVIEAISFCTDTYTIERLMDTDRRTSVKDAARERLRKLQSNQTAPSGVVYRGAYSMQEYSEEAFLKEINSVALEEVAPHLDRWLWRFNSKYTESWLANLTDEQLAKVMTHRTAHGSDVLIGELLRRGRIDEAFQKAVDNALISALVKNCEINEDLYDRIRNRGIGSAGPRFRFTPDGVAAVKRHRAFVTMIQNHLITVEELATEFGDFSIQELGEIFGSRMSEHELSVLEDPLLRSLTAIGGPAPGFIVHAYNRKVIRNKRLARLIALSDTPRDVLNYMLKLSTEDLKEALDEFQDMRGDDVASLLGYLGMADQTAESQALLELLLTRVPLQIRSLSQIGGWVIAEILERTTAKLEPGDWPLFFRLFDSFTGTVDELVMTITAVRG